MSRERLELHRQIWKEKEVLRLIYGEWFEKIASRRVTGTSVEIGSGPGLLKSVYPDIIATDIISVPWIDVCCNAEKLPFHSNSVDNVILFDVVHHIEDPLEFFDEAVRVLRRAGRILILDVHLSPVSSLVLRLFHQEPVITSVDPFQKIQRSGSKDPFDANQAMVTLLFKKQLKKFQARYPQLEVTEKEIFSMIAYPLSGGFEHRGLIAARHFQFWKRVEKALTPLTPLLAFRSFIVLTKTV